jgi:CRISPR/Cas system CSM-associated protein Csm3 (group 7 of RAMP superfamily)
MDLQYQIKFFSAWHCGSGLGSGADLDAVVLRDADGFPFVPGKTLKGLLRDAATLLASWGDETMSESFVREVFGHADQRGRSNHLDDRGSSANVHFGDALLTTEQVETIGNREHELFRKMARTAIDSEGQVVEHSLRRIEVVVPLRLSATIYGVDTSHEAAIRRAFGFVKEMGSGRNRGLGRCEWKVEAGR